MIKLFNAATGKVQKFEPQDPNRVTMYVCGSTVYAMPHIGNIRSAIAFDVLFRLLRHIYGADHVEYATNYTDVDDRIIDRAKTIGGNMDLVTNPIIESYELAVARLFMLRPNYRPRATAYINDMIGMIEGLIAKGHAYVGAESVYFNVPSSKYESFQSNRQEEGIDPESDEKRDIRDFALWKFSKPDEPHWDSPWGKGRPGWHIECSAMIKNLFGETIDIHGGGSDLEFPHHDAENQQSSNLHDKPLANYWLHNGIVTVNGTTKMSKRDNSHARIDIQLREVSGEVIRMALLRTHYRGNIAFREYYQNENKALLDVWYSTMWKYRDHEIVESEPLPEVVKALSSDLNTVEAIRLISDTARELNRKFTPGLFGQFVASAKLLGFFNFSADDWFHAGANHEEINRLISARNQAKEEMNWGEADSLREVVSVTYGIQLQDTSDGVFWQTITGPII